MARPGFALLLACGLALMPLAATAAGQTQADGLISQGNTLDNQGDHDGAIALYSQAINLGDEYDARLDRSVAYANSGHYAEAFQDLDRARALKPDDSAPLSARYWFDFELYQFPAVIATIDQMKGMQPADPYAPLLRFIAASRLGQNTDALLAKTLTVRTENQWPQAAAQMFLGKVTPDQLLQWVEQTGDLQASCEAPFYIGEYFLLHHQRNMAQTALQSTERDECRPLMEYYAAQGELMSLGNEYQ
jgi:tetratricopeptide (TPR) repeat protein